MKKTASILCLLILLFQSAGYFAFFKVRQQQIRHEMKQQIKAGVAETELVLLKISHSTQENRNEFQRIHACEFRYRGKMYDVARKLEKDGMTWFYCICDEKETELFAQLDEQVRKEMQNAPGNEKQREKVQQWMNSLFLIGKMTFSAYDLPGHELTCAYLFSIIIWEPPPEKQPPRV